MVRFNDECSDDEDHEKYDDAIGPAITAMQKQKVKQRPVSQEKISDPVGVCS